jgi:hypothetical protein
MIDENDNLDNLIDRALASYTPRVARPGLEQRILASVTADGSTRPQMRSWKLAWAASAALAAAAVLFVALILSRPPAPGPGLAMDQGHPPVSGLNTPVPSRSAVPSRPVHPVPLQRAATPLAARQPTQQELIAKLLANSPETIPSLARAAEEQDKPIDFQPIRVDPLVIEPIQITSMEDNPAGTSGSI